ncbi:hypothetical protein VU00_11612, partial [Candidatus Electrothrix marina]
CSQENHPSLLDISCSRSPYLLTYTIISREIICYEAVEIEQQDCLWKKGRTEMIQAKNIPAIEDFIKALEPVIRRVVREELNAIVEQQPEVFQLTPDSPLYDELVELKERKDRGELEFISHDEVWG